MFAERVGFRAVVVACGVGLSACSGGGDSTKPPAVTAVAMSASGATAFTGVAGGTPSSLPAVKVTGSNGAPFAGQAVSFQVSSGGGTLTGGTATTNTAGIASVGGWTLGTVAGPQTVTATSGSFEAVVFTTTVTAGPASRLSVVSGNNQQAAVGAAVPQPLAVKVADQFDNPVSGAEVSFQVASGGGQMATTTAASNSQGIATVGGWILGTTLGDNTVSASIGSAATVTFAATATTGAPARLAIASGDAQAGEPGAQLSTALSVRVTDSFGNPVAGVPVGFAVTGGSGTLSASSATSSEQGIASTSLTLTDVGVSNVTATSSAIAGVAVVFSASTGPTLVGNVSLSSFLPRAFAALARGASGPAMMGGPLSKAISAAGVSMPDPSPHLSAREAARRVSTKGRLIISFRPDAFSLPQSAMAYRTHALRDRATDAYRSALAVHETAGRLSVRDVSPAIAAVRVQVPDGQDPNAVAAMLRADPRIAAVEEDVVLYTLDEPALGSVGDAVPERRLPPWLAAPVTEVYPTDPIFQSQLWHYSMIDLPRAWKITTGSSAVRVAIVDAGIRPDHPAVSPLLSTAGDHFDFTDGVTAAFTPAQTICATGQTFSTIRGTDADLALPRNAAQAPNDVYLASSASTCWSRNATGSHGTHVAGTVGSRANDGIGGTGVNWNVTLIAVRVLGITGTGFAFDVAQGILYAGGLPATYTGAPIGFTVQMPAADIMNMSLGSTASSAVIANAVTAASANTLIVASAGNNVSSNPSYPGALPEALSVVALAPDFGLANYTNVGSTVDIAAPGGDYRFGFSSGVASSTWNFQNGTPNYAYYQGTSMAAPHVTGVAALIKAANPSFTPAQLRARLLQGAIDLGPPGRDDRFGAGLVNAYNSLTGTSGPSASTVVRAINSSTGAVAKSATVGSNGRFTLANLPAASYFIVAGQDEGSDPTLGVPGRRLGWFGGAGMSAVALSGTSVQNVGLTMGTPLEVEPNDVIAQANPLVVDSWVAGNLAVPDARDIYAVRIPATGTYSLETSGVLGACGFALEVDTVLRLLDANGTPIATNGDTVFPTASYPGSFCSYLSMVLLPGTYFVEVSPLAGSSGSYRLHVRSRP